MKKARNQNRPKKGDQIKVDPIKKLLADDPRNSALFSVGINTNLRASDLLRIRVGQVRDLKPGDEIELKEKKTGKSRRIALNKACVQAIQRQDPMPTMISCSRVREAPLRSRPCIAW